MSTKAHKTGSIAVHLACAKLIYAGHTVTVTARNASHVDVLSFCEGAAYSFQVKANSQQKSFWLLNKNFRQFVHPTFYYVFINLNNDMLKAEYYTVSSADLVRIGQEEDSKKKTSTWYFVTLEDVVSCNTDFVFV